MNVFRRIFSRPEGEHARVVRQIIEKAITEVRQPKGPAQSAITGLKTRELVFSVVEKLEAELNQLVVAVAQKEGVLMTHPKLDEAIKRHPQREIIEPALTLCFPTPAAAAQANRMWPATVARYRSVENTDDVVDEKATLLVAFVISNLDAAQGAYSAIGGDSEMTEEKIIQIKIEEAALWYRVIDELTWRYLPSKREWFVDHFIDGLAQNLALQGGPPALICNTFEDRSREYSEYKQWVAEGEGGSKGTLLWEAAKHAGQPIEANRNPIFLVYFAEAFVNRLARALIYELLTGREREAPAPTG